MCNLSEALIEESRKEGMILGKAQAIIELLEEDNCSRTFIEEKLQKKLGITLKEAKKYYLKYSKNKSR